MELVALKCPKCGGELEVHEGQKKTFCKYCGSQILLDDGNRIINVIDEARLKEIKLNKEVSDFDQKLRDEEASGRYKNASQKQGWIIARFARYIHACIQRCGDVSVCICNNRFHMLMGGSACDNGAY